MTIAIPNLHHPCNFAGCNGPEYVLLCLKNRRRPVYPMKQRSMSNIVRVITAALSTVTDVWRPTCAAAARTHSGLAVTFVTSVTLILF